MTHICVSKLTMICTGNGLSPGRRQAIIWTNAGILLIRTLGTNFSEILSEIHAFSFNKIWKLKMMSVKWRPFCLGLNVLISDKVFHWKDALAALAISITLHMTPLPLHWLIQVPNAIMRSHYNRISFQFAHNIYPLFRPPSMLIGLFRVLNIWSEL